MEIKNFEHDLVLYCVSAESFPDGVMNAHERLHDTVSLSSERMYMGLSRPEGGSIIYKAGATELSDGELASHGFDRVVLPKGNYQSITIKNFMRDVSSIGAAFQELTSLPDIDPNGYCVEWYVNNEDVVCMVRIIE